MLDLVRLSPRTLFPPGGEDLYRHVALLLEMREGMEVLDVACGQGVTLEYFVGEHGVVGSGVDHDPFMIELAEERARDRELDDRMHFQHHALDDLPYKDDVFDVVIGELGLAAHAPTERAVAELARVTKPSGTVVLIQLVWTDQVPESRQRILVEHLGARPLMLVEWKKLLRSAGVVDLHVEDWSDEETTFRPQVKMPFPDFAELFTLREKLRILRRAWRRWGWRGVRSAMLREQEVHRLLTRERLLGLTLIRGSVWTAEEGAMAEGLAREENPAEEEERGGAGTDGDGEGDVDPHRIAKERDGD